MHPRTAKIPMMIFLICTKLLVFCNFMSNSWTMKVKWLIIFYGKLVQMPFFSLLLCFKVAPNLSTTKG
jgi:hypothetical protein